MKYLVTFLMMLPTLAFSSGKVKMPELLRGGEVSITLCARAQYKNGVTTCLKKGATYTKPSEIWAIVPRKNLGKGKTIIKTKTVVVEKEVVRPAETKRMDWRFTGLVGHGYRGLKARGTGNGNVTVLPREDVVFGASVGYKLTDTEEVSATILNNNTQLLGISKFFD